MQQAGENSTEESAGRPRSSIASSSSPTRTGIQRWFPRGFGSQRVDWINFEKHLSMVPDLAFEVTTDASNGVVVKSEIIPKGVSALHLVVSCCNPPAPLSIVQRLIDINPDALHQTEEEHGWNALHCALLFNASLRSNQDIMDLLIATNPDLVTQLSTTLAEENGLPPLAFAQCTAVVPALVKVTPIKLVTSILKKIFLCRKLLGGSIEAMEQIIREISVLELRQKRSILAPGIIPERSARKQSLVEYCLQQASLRRQRTQERTDLLRLVDILIQTTYCLAFHKDGEGDENVLTVAPPPLQCLKTLVIQQKIKRQALEQYQSTNVGTDQYKENSDLVEPLEADQRPASLLNRADHEDVAINGEPSGQPQRRQTNVSQLDENPLEANNPYVLKLLKSKEQLDSKIDQSLEMMRQTAIALEGYREMYSQTVDKLYHEAKVLDDNQRLSASTKSAAAGSLESAVVALASSTPPKPPVRRDSDEFSKENASRLRLDATIQDAIENMTAAVVHVDLYNKSLSAESKAFAREQEDQKIIDFGLFRSKEHDEAAQAMEDLEECRIHKEGIVKCMDEIKRQLDDADAAAALAASRRDVSVSMESSKLDQSRQELAIRWMTLRGEINDLTLKIDKLRQICSCRRQDLGAHMIKARRLLSNKTSASKTIRTKAGRFLRHAKNEMRELMNTLVSSGTTSSVASTRGQRRRIRKQRRAQRKADEESEELTRMTKRMRL